MQVSARNLHFEQATVLREDLKAVTWLSRRAADMARAREAYTFVYPVAAAETSTREDPARSGPDIWYLIRRGIIEGALPAPVSAADRRQAKRVLKQWLIHDHCVGSVFSPRPETLALVASWFRNHRGELKKTFLPEVGMPPTAVRRHTSAASGTVKV